MLNETKKSLQAELDKYLQGSTDFSEYYPGMNVLCSDLYKMQLQDAITLVKEQEDVNVHSFEMYLDTIILNMHTKVRKYKKSIYFDDENVKEIQNQGFTIPFYIDEGKNIYILLGIVESETEI